LFVQLNSPDENVHNRLKTYKHLRVLYNLLERFIQGFGWGNLMERAHLEDPGVVGRIMLSWIFRKWDGRHGTD